MMGCRCADNPSYVRFDGIYRIDRIRFGVAVQSNLSIVLSRRRMGSLAAARNPSIYRARR
jgi:hypothetical protein